MGVLAGALLVGESVRASLRDIFLQRLGRTDYVVTASGFFRERLAADLDRYAACPLIVLEGLVTEQNSGRRAAGVQIYGVDDRFWKFHRIPGQAPASDSVLLSPGLIEELGAEKGSGLLIRIEKPSAIPSESLHGRKDDAGSTLRFTLAGPASEFSLRPHQGMVRAAFINLERLRKEIEQPTRVNAILLATGESYGQVSKELGARVTLEDLGVRIRELTPQGVSSVENEAALIPNAIADKVQKVASELGLSATPVFTYLANTLRVGTREVPYSLVTAMDMPGLQADSILLNAWAAGELKARAGDTVTLEYYLWHPDGRLLREQSQFRVGGVLPMTGLAVDRDLAPKYPGITETTHLRDWDPPFPMDLSRIRPRDEEYWDRYRTAPKAFIGLQAGQKLWASRFGRITSIRLAPAESAARFRHGLSSSLNPLESGMSLYAAREQGMQASRGATDFGEYFTYFSFFLMVSAVLLAALFFRLGVEQRLREIGLLRAVGWAPSSIRGLFLAEGAILASIGSLLGTGLAVGYCAAILFGLKTWWFDAVGTRLIELHVSPLALAGGAVGGVLIALGCIAGTLRAIAPMSPRQLLAGARPDDGATGTKRQSARRAAPVFGVAGLALLAAGAWGMLGEAAAFFGAGACLLIAALSCASVWLRRQPSNKWTPGRSVWWLGLRSATSRPGRSLLSIALIASATFVIVSVEAFRRPASAEADRGRSSGTGGFPLLAESILPLYHDLNSAEGRQNLSLPEDMAVRFFPFRLRPGDDASCLNLYQPQNPRVLAPAAEFIQQGRFKFQKSLAATPEEAANPWLLLNSTFADGAIPAIADANSLAYVLHLKLGQDFLLPAGGQMVRLRMVGALADSLFQGEILISESNFLRLFPDVEGHRFFLLETEKADAVAGTIEDALADFGFDIASSGARLAGFHRVENAYLSTFQTLGGLGLVLGTLGLAAVLLRNVLERGRDLALLRAVGYRSRDLAAMIVAENALLLSAGLAIGSLCALVAIAPALLSRGGSLPAASLAALLLLVAVTGLAASLSAARAAVRLPLLASLRSE